MAKTKSKPQETEQLEAYESIVTPAVYVDCSCGFSGIVKANPDDPKSTPCPSCTEREKGED